MIGGLLSNIVHNFKSIFGLHDGGAVKGARLRFGEQAFRVSDPWVGPEGVDDSSEKARSLLNNDEYAKTAVCTASAAVQQADVVSKDEQGNVKRFTYDVTSLEPPRLDLPTMIARSNKKFEHLFLGEKLTLHRPVLKHLGQRMMDDLHDPMLSGGTSWHIKITKSRLEKDGKALAWHNSTFGKVFAKIMLECSTIS